MILYLQRKEENTITEVHAHHEPHHCTVKEENDGERERKLEGKSQIKLYASNCKVFSLHDSQHLVCYYNQDIESEWSWLSILSMCVLSDTKWYFNYTIASFLGLPCFFFVCYFCSVFRGRPGLIHHMSGCEVGVGRRGAIFKLSLKASFLLIKTSSLNQANV